MTLSVDFRFVGATMAKLIQEHSFLEPIEDDIDIYEQVQAETINKLDLNLTLSDSDLQNGDILIFQYRPDDYTSEEELDEYSAIPEYFTYLLDRVEVTFAPRFEDDEPSTSFVLELLYSNSYDSVVHAAANALKMDPLYIRLYQHNNLENAPKSDALRHSRNSGPSGICLRNMLPMDRNEKQVAKLYYERLEYSIVELEKKKLLTVRLSPYVPDFEINVLHRVDLHLDPTSNVEAALAEIVRRNHIDTRVTELRLLETRDKSMLLREVPSMTPLSHLMNQSQYIVDAIPKAKKSLEQRSVIGVMHFAYSHDSYITTHHNPGLIVINDADTFKTLRTKIQTKFNISDDAIAKCKLALIVDNKGTPLENIPGDMDTELVYDKLPIGDKRCFVGVECQATTKSDTRRKDNGIKIRSS